MKFWKRHGKTVFTHYRTIWDLWRDPDVRQKTKEEARKAAIDFIPHSKKRTPEHFKERQEELQVCLKNEKQITSKSNCLFVSMS